MGVTFNLAHWFFSYSYLVLSYNVELVINEMQEDTYNRRLKLLNVSVVAFIIIVPSFVWTYDMKENYLVSYSIFVVSQLSLILSCAVLAWALRRLKRLVESDSDLIAKKSMMMWHLMAYLLVIITNIIQTFFVFITINFSGCFYDEVFTITLLVVLCIC